MKKILYVDDEPFNLEMFENLFEDTFEVFTANSGPQGLSVFTKESVNLVITDMKMPQMTGLELVKRIRKKNNTIPCFVLTGFGLKDEIKQAIDEGDLNGYFAKPFDTDKLLNSINAVI